MRLYLLRHGSVEVAGAFYGQLDVALSQKGHQQAQRLAEIFATHAIAAVFASDLQRTLDTARPIARQHGLEPVAQAAFREMSLGVLEGMSRIDAQMSYPELATLHYSDMWSHRFPGGENLRDIAARARPKLDEIRSRFDGQTVVLVAHNSINRVLLGDALGLTLDRVFDFEQDFGCVNRIDFGRRTRVGLINWTPEAPA